MNPAPKRKYIRFGRIAAVGDDVEGAFDTSKKIEPLRFIENAAADKKLLAFAPDQQHLNNEGVVHYMEKGLVVNNKVTFLDVMKIAGTWSALFIGAGYATGAEMFQYFLPYGKMAYPAVSLAMIGVGLVALGIVKTAAKENFQNPEEILYYYGGRIGGKILLFFASVSVVSIPTAIMAGFGATFRTFTGAPDWVGALTLGVACLITVLLGLRRVVDITGMVGPVIVLVAMFTTIFFLFKNRFNIAPGMAMAPDLASVKMGSSWWSASLLYVGWVPVFSATYLAAATTTVKNKKSAGVGVILGSVFIFVCAFVMISSYFTDVETLFPQPTPNIFLAMNISKFLGGAFVFVVFCAVYSSSAPAFYSFCRSLATEKSKRYYVLVFASVGLSTFVAMFIPFATLFNIIFTVIGYLGYVFVAMMIARAVKNYRAKKRAQKTTL